MTGDAPRPALERLLERDFSEPWPHGDVREKVTARELLAENRLPTSSPSPAATWLAPLSLSNNISAVASGNSRRVAHAKNAMLGRAVIWRRLWR